MLRSMSIQATLAVSRCIIYLMHLLPGKGFCCIYAAEQSNRCTAVEGTVAVLRGGGLSSMAIQATVADHLLMHLFPEKGLCCIYAAEQSQRVIALRLVGYIPASRSDY